MTICWQLDKNDASRTGPTQAKSSNFRKRRILKIVRDVLLEKAVFWKFSGTVIDFGRMLV